MDTQLTETDPAFERFRAALIERDPDRYPEGAHFISAEAEWATRVLLRHIRAGEPVVLVFADGEERIVDVRRPRSPADKPARVVDLMAALEESLAAVKGEDLRSTEARNIVGLSDREIEILHMIDAGRTNEQIADEFGVSVKTVVTHRSRILGKLRRAEELAAAD